MKKIMLLFLAMSFLFLAACGDYQESAINTSVLSSQTETDVESLDIESVESLKPLQPLEQPIIFKNISQVTEFVKQKNFEYYPEMWHETYYNMCQKFEDVGYFPYAVSGLADTMNNIAVIYPRLKYADSGICYWFSYEGLSCQVRICHFDDKATDDISEYHTRRFDITDLLFVESFNNKNFYGRQNSDGEFSVYYMEDENHYIKVSIPNNTSKERVLTFAKDLSILKIYTE